MSKQQNARERIEQAGRAPVLGWAQDRKVNLRETDIRQTFERVRQAIKQSKRVS